MASLIVSSHPLTTGSLNKPGGAHYNNGSFSTFMSTKSAAGLLALLEESDDRLKQHALSCLLKVVDALWFQVSSSLPLIEALAEDEDFEGARMAGLLCARVFYHLGETSEALSYALSAGALFDPSDASEFTQTLIAKCIETYVAARQATYDAALKASTSADGAAADIDKRIEPVVERMLKACVDDGNTEQAVGLAIDCRRLDALETAVSRSAMGGHARGSPDAVAAALRYALNAAHTCAGSRAFRIELLRVLVRLHRAQTDVDHLAVSRILVHLGDAKGVAELLAGLVAPSGDSMDAEDAAVPEPVLVAYQVAFELFEAEQPPFLAAVRTEVETMVKQPAAESVEGEGAAAAAAATTTSTHASVLLRILSGTVPMHLRLEFLYSKNSADLLVLKGVKDAIDSRSSVNHGACVLANAYMHTGTTVDTFLRENLDWLSRSTNWNKFSATAGLGCIHRGHVAQSRALLAPYLPRTGGGSSSPYSEGGALYALGLIHVNQGSSATPFLLQSLRAASHEVIQHGACLGVGLASMGTADAETYEDLKGVLYTDNAVAGEAAGIGIGLLLAGRMARAGDAPSSGGDADDAASALCASASSELLAYAHDTSHEKISRGIAIGLALMCFGAEEGADTLIATLCNDTSAVLRYGGMLALGLAYRGTGSNAAVAKLLHHAVSDASDDVRRAAVTSLGFVLPPGSEQCAHVVGLLAESYNSHVRYGAAMALGLCHCGSYSKTALELLDTMSKDGVDFVRQGAAIAKAMCLVGTPESVKAVPAFRKALEKSYKDKHEETMAKMGSIMAVGILDAGGRNCTLSRGRDNVPRMTSTLGMALFMQYWYWYPLSYMLSASFSPCAMIAVNGKLAMPSNFVACCDAKASVFAYPPKLSSDAGKEKARKGGAAVLSTTAKAAKMRKQKAAASGGEGGKAAMETESSVPTKGGAEGTASGDGAATEDGKKEEEETPYNLLSNPCRVVPTQETKVRFFSLPSDGDAAMTDVSHENSLAAAQAGVRYTPVRGDGATCGIVVLRDSRPEDPEELVATTTSAEGAEEQAAAGGAAAAEEEEEEEEPPAPFEYQPEA